VFRSPINLRKLPTYSILYSEAQDDLRRDLYLCKLTINNKLIMNSVMQKNQSTKCKQLLKEKS
jgi:hypothetical protein